MYPYIFSHTPGYVLATQFYSQLLFHTVTNSQRDAEILLRNGKGKSVQQTLTVFPKIYVSVRSR